MKNDIKDFVATCETCQRNKGDIVKTLQELQPLEIPTYIWVDITVDFIVGLPMVGKNM